MRGVDTSGYALTYNGTSWSAPPTWTGPRDLNALSCASTTFCDGGDDAGNVLSYNGTSWSSAVDIDGSRSINTISCPTQSFCVTADRSGYGAVDRAAPTNTAQFTWNTNGSLPLVLSDGTNDYIYGPSATPVEQISLASSTPTYMTYTAADDTWLSTNEAGDETGFWGYDAFGNLAFGNPTRPFGYSGQYTDTTTSLVNDEARWYESQTGEFISRDPDFASTDTAYTYAGDDPVNGGDPTGLYNCSGIAENKVIASYSRGKENYNLVCGRRDPRGFGIRHIQEDKTKGGWSHFAGNLSNELIHHIIPVTIRLGRPVNNTGVGVGYELTWVAISPALPPEPEPFDIIVAVNFQFGRVVSAYSPDSTVDRNPLTSCSWAGANLCEGGSSFQPVLASQLTSDTYGDPCPTSVSAAPQDVTYLPQ